MKHGKGMGKAHCTSCENGSLEKPNNRTPGKVISKNRPMSQHNHRTFTLGGRGSGSGIR